MLIAVRHLKKKKERKEIVIWRGVWGERHPAQRLVSDCPAGKGKHCELVNSGVHSNIIKYVNYAVNYTMKMSIQHPAHPLYISSVPKKYIEFSDRFPLRPKKKTKNSHQLSLFKQCYLPCLSPHTTSDRYDLLAMLVGATYAARR